jgi:hypothetical protein
MLTKLVKYLSGPAFALIMLAALCSSGANAAVVSIDFSGISVEGQSYEGSTLGIMTITSEVGSVAYTNSYGGGLISGSGGSSDIFLTFSAPISSISIRGGDGGGDNDAFSLYLYEFGTNNFLGRFDTPVFGGANEPEWYTLMAAAANIGKVVFDEGNSGVLPGTIAGTGGVAMTDVSYDTATIPEPGTSGLVLMSFAGFAAMVYRRRARR